MAQRPPMVLLVDHDADSVAMYAFGFLAMGLQPIPADGVVEGLARAREMAVDAVVIDLTGAEPSGLALTERLRADARHASVGILAVGSDVSGALEERFTAAGGDRFLLKPCAPDALVLEIRQVLASRTRPYHQAFARIRTEYTELPGLRMTFEQVRRLTGVDATICRMVVDDLVRGDFLHADGEGTLGRRTGQGRAASAGAHGLV